MAKILIIEDEKELVSSLDKWLSGEGHSIDAAYNAGEAIEALARGHYDVLILDLLLPDLSGFDLCRKYRQEGGCARILMLTALDSDINKEEGFDAGADDYVTKPFKLKEVSARIKALMKRSLVMNGGEILLSVGDLVLDAGKFKVTSAGKEIKLLPQEFALLQFLMREPNKVFSIEELARHVWRGQSTMDTVRTHIKTLRKKIGVRDAGPSIETIHGIGYSLRH